MQQFCELMKEYISKGRISVKKLAADMGIDRTLLQKYIAGSRKPKNRREVDQIALCMMLSPAEQDRLVTAYFQGIYGRKSYESFQQIKRFLEGNIDLKTEEQKCSVPGKEPLAEEFELQENCRVFYGKMQVADALTGMFNRGYVPIFGEGVKPNVRIIMQPDQKELMVSLLRLCGNISAQVEHIICLDRDKEDNDNFSLITPVLSMLFCNDKYQIRYYYEDTDSHINEMSLFSTMILLEEYAFLCNRQGDECIVYHQKECVEFLQRRYDDIAARTTELNIKRKTTVQIEETARKLRATGNKNCWFGWTPCMTFGLTREIYESHLLLPEPDKTYLIDAQMRDIQIMMEAKPYVDCCAEEGLRYFMETGDLPEYPEYFYRKPERRTRIEVLENLVKTVESDRVRVYISNPAKLNMVKYFSLTVNAEGKVEISRAGVYGYEEVYLEKEFSICRSIYQFEEFAREDGWFYDAETSLGILRKVLEEYRGKEIGNEAE